MKIGKGRDSRLYELDSLPTPYWPFPGHWVEVEVNPLTIEAEESKAQFQYCLESVQVQVIRPSDWSFINCLPVTTPDAASTYLEKRERQNKLDVGLASISPKVMFSSTRGSTKEQVRNLSKIVVYRSMPVSETQSATRWTYEIEDERAKRLGVTVESPRVKFGLVTLDGPHLTVNVLTHWSLETNLPDFFKQLWSKANKPVF